MQLHSHIVITKKGGNRQNTQVLSTEYSLKQMPMEQKQGFLRTRKS